MTNTRFDLPYEKVSRYRTTVLERQAREQRALERRKAQAWVVAKRAALLLRDRFHATRVVVFGSLVHEGCFTRWSDVDIAAWGIASKDTLRALGAVMDLDTSFEINFVDINTCRSSLRQVIEREGVDV